VTTLPPRLTAASQRPGSGLTTSSPAGLGELPAPTLAVTVTRSYAVDDSEVLRLRGWQQAAADPDLAAAMGYRADVGVMTPDIALALLVGGLGAEELAERAEELGLRTVYAATTATSTAGPVCHLEDDLTETDDAA
jgi:hypothetical protein